MSEMSEFEALLELWMMVKRGEIREKLLTPKDRQRFWEFVQNYIVGLSKKLFKQHNFRNRVDETEVTAHDMRVMAFYDFVEFYAIPKGKSARWILKVFKFRFVDIEGLLSLKRKGYVHVDDIIKEGAPPTRLYKIRILAGARRLCKARDFKGTVPCMKGKIKHPMPLWLYNRWRSEFERMRWLENLSNPLPLREDLFGQDAVMEKGV